MVGLFDPVAAKIRWAQRMGEMPASLRAATLDLGAEIRDRAITHRAAQEVAALPSKAEMRRAREMALTERLEDAQRRDV